MAVYWRENTLTTQTGALDAQSDRLLNVSRSVASGASASSREDAKMVKAGKDFETILLGSWLQQAEKSFATVPGSDGQNDDDGSKDQFQGIAMQALAGSLTTSGGIGIAPMITNSLRSHGGSFQADPSRARPPASSSPARAAASETSGLNKSSYNADN